MPPQDGVWRHLRRDLTQDPAPEAVAIRPETPSLGVGQPQPPATQVFFEDTGLFPQVFDDLELVAIHPARQRHE